MVVPSGATPFMTKSSMPTGGVTDDISMFGNTKTPHQTGSMPKALTIGMNMGMVTITMDPLSIKVPMKSRVIYIRGYIFR